MSELALYFGTNMLMYWVALNMVLLPAWILKRYMLD